MTNRCAQKENRRMYYLLHRKARLIYQRNYDQTHKKEKRQYLRHRYKTDKNFRILCILRSRLRHALKVKFVKSDETKNLLGCSLFFLQAWLKFNFKKGMSFFNIHVDHIRPCSSFPNIRCREEQQKCFNWSNLQPLFPKDNLRKSYKRDLKLEAIMKKKAKTFLAQQIRYAS